MRHIDLFSGIGGFALAARNVWGEEYENVCFCEINKYAQAVIRKQFGKDAVIYGDIRGLTAYAHKQVESALQVDAIPRAGMPESSCAIDLLTGGFPCQPFSQAGQRRGTEDDRYLWPEMLRVIHEFKPTWVVAENVRGLLTINDGVVFEQVCVDLENEGYEVQPFVIPACAVNAPHRRDRVWIVAKSKDERTGDARDTEPERLPNRDAGTVRGQTPDEERERSTLGHFAPEQWDQNWLEVATRFCGVLNGLPGEMDGATLSKARHRVERLKALGNAIVPQVAIQIFRGLKLADTMEQI